MTVLGLDNSFEVIMVQGRTVAGVHDATSTAAALELAGKTCNRRSRESREVEPGGAPDGGSATHCG